MSSASDTSRRTERCSWCGGPVERGDGFRAAEPAGSRRAVFCRLEHVVPWFIKGPHWDPGELEEPSGLGADIDRCAHCDSELDERRVLLVRHRGDHRIPDGFCSAEHLFEWAKAGGRYS